MTMLSLPPALAAPACPIPTSAQDTSFDYMGTRIDQHTGLPGSQSAYSYVTAVKIVDADGAPNAYHPKDMADECPDSGLGLDCLDAAGYPHGSWWQNVLAADPRAPDRPAIQRKGPFKGYFVSMTSLQNVEWGGPANPASYVDASATPYIVLPAPIYRTHGMGAWVTSAMPSTSTMAAPRLRHCRRGPGRAAGRSLDGLLGGAGRRGSQCPQWRGPAARPHRLYGLPP
jgi:hypothetical protein